MQNKTEYLKDLSRNADFEESECNKNILLKYSGIQESLPFQIYFQNEFSNLIKKDLFKKEFFLKEEKDDIDIIGSINNTIVKDIEEKNQRKEEKKQREEEKKKREEEKKIKKEEKKQKRDNKNLIMSDNNNSLKNLSNDDENNNKDLQNNDFNISNIDSSNNNSSIIQSFTSINNSITENTSKNNINDSDLSYMMDIVQEKLQQNMNNIDEIILEKEKLFNQIINENNESKDNRLIYFEDTNNLLGSQFENSATKYIFELINCLSPTRDFSFYYNVTLKSEHLNKIFIKKGLNEIKGNIQLDFVIRDLRIIDLMNILVYLYPNIINLNGLKKAPFKTDKELNFNQLVKLRNHYKNSTDKIDIFGEIGSNIFTEDEKIGQLEKYTKINENIEKLMDIDVNEADKILKFLKMKKENKKLIMFLTNGIFSNIFINELSKKKFFEAQEEHSTNSLIIYLNSNYISKENIIIDDLIFNYYEDKKQMKNEKHILQEKGKDIILEEEKKKKIFVEQLIDLKKRKIKQNKINEKFRKISLKLNNFEKNLKAINKNYASFVKKENIDLNMNKFTNIFIGIEKKIIESLGANLDKLDKIKLQENIEGKFDYEINILLLHHKNKNFEKNIFEKIRYKDKIIKVYDLEYIYDSNFYSYDKVESEILFRKNKKIFIIVLLCTTLLQDYLFLDKISKSLISNYLSYLYIIFQDEKIFLPSTEFEGLPFGHIIKYSYKKNIEEKIKDNIMIQFIEIDKYYEKFVIKRTKYAKITEYYDKIYKYILIRSSSNNINEKNINSENIIEKYTKLLVEKISQDICFYLTLNIDKTEEIKKMIEKDLELIIDNGTIIQLFLKEKAITKIIDDLSSILNNFSKTLIDNNKNNNNYINIEELDYNEYYKEIISIDGTPIIYNDNEEKAENEAKSINDDNEEDMLNKENQTIDNNDESDKKDISKGKANDDKDSKLNSQELDILNISPKETTKKPGNKEDNFKIQFLIEGIKDNIKESLTLVNLNLYYTYFFEDISKIFKNHTLKLLSKKVIKEK